MTRLFFMCLISLWASLSFAQAPYSQLTWTWSQGSGGALDHFEVRCGHSSGTYPFVTSVPAGTFTLDVYVATNREKGQFFCVLAAVNSAGQSLAPEITFILTIPPLGPPFGPFGRETWYSLGWLFSS